MSGRITLQVHSSQRQAVLDARGGSGDVVHVFGPPVPGLMGEVCGHSCYEEDDPARPAEWSEVVFHGETLALGADLVCLTCGETTRAGDS